MEKNLRTQAIVGIQKGLGTIKDRNTGARSFGLPFEFPDGTKGFVYITRLKREQWEPADDIESLLITFTP